MPDVENLAYGFGLFTVDDLGIGRVVGHGGGYPGFGSHMRWHPASGLGVVALANARYAPASLLARDQLAELVRAEVAPVRRTRPNTTTRDARAAVEGLLERWDDARAAELFAMNVELDEPIAARRAFVERLHERHGALRPDDAEPTESQTSYHLSWWMRGDRGRVHVEILLSPELPPRVQTFGVTSVPEPPAALQVAASRIAAAVARAEGRPAIDWPADVAIGEDVDLDAIRRALVATAARFAPVRLGPTIAGDGETKATFRLRSDRGEVDLALELDPKLGCVTSVSLVPVRRVPPDLD
jgi:hypothetical protein